MTTEQMKVQLINPMIEDENGSYLYFEMDDQARHIYKKDIAAGLAKSKYLVISKEFIPLESGNNFTHIDVHHILDVEDSYLIVYSDNYEGTYPTAIIKTREQLIKMLDNMKELYQLTCIDEL